MRRQGLEAYLTLFLENEKVLRRTNRVRNHRSMLTRFLEHLRSQRIRDIRTVSEEHVRSFLREVKESPTRFGGSLSPVSFANWITELRAFFRFLESRRFILRNPAAGVRTPSFERLPRRVLSSADAARLMESADRHSVVGLRNRALLETLYGTGIRGGECSRLDVRDVDLSAGRLWIRDGKGRKDRVVPLSGRAAAALDLYLKESRPELCRPAESALFVSHHTGGRLTLYGIQMAVRNSARAAGIRGHLGPHALRHTCATHLLQGGADIRHVQAILGHKEITTTQRYTRVELGDVERMLEKAHPRERQGRGRRGRMEPWRKRSPKS